MTDLYDYFTHGGDYDERRLTGRVRDGCCHDCAFRASPTVRPPDVSLEELSAFSADLDDFFCHNPDDQGRYSTCAGWSAITQRTGDTQHGD